MYKDVSIFREALSKYSIYPDYNDNNCLNILIN
jgi:hypothetical protein